MSCSVKPDVVTAVGYTAMDRVNLRRAQSGWDTSETITFPNCLNTFFGFILPLFQTVVFLGDCKPYSIAFSFKYSVFEYSWSKGE